MFSCISQKQRLQRPPKMRRICMRKTTLTTQSHISRFGVQILVNYEIFKLSLNLSLTHLIAQTACYELKGNVSPLIRKEIFHESLKISKFTRISMENHSGVTRWQKFSYKSFQFSVAVAIATFEIYGWKFTGYLIWALANKFSLKANYFRVYRMTEYEEFRNFSFIIIIIIIIIINFI